MVINLQTPTPFWPSKWVIIARVAALLSKASLSRPAATAAESGTPSLCACPSCLPKLCRSAAGARPHTLYHWFCRQNLWLSSETAFGCDGQMTSTGSNWTQIWILLPDQRVVKAWFSPKSWNELCVVGIPFRSIEDAELGNWDKQSNYFNTHLSGWLMQLNCFLPPSQNTLIFKCESFAEKSF